MCRMLSMEPSLENIYIDAAPEALDALDALQECGHEAWLVGGCVRDALLARPLHDFDIASSAPWEEAERILKTAGFTIHRTGEKHGTITAVKNNVPLEITTYRSEGSYSDGRHPDVVEPARTIEEDLVRRDFTINALAYHPIRGLLDCQGGMEDLQAGIIRAVGNPDERFKEDGLRILRGLRLSAELGFHIEDATLQAMRACKMCLRNVSSERITAEMDRLLKGDFACQALLVAIDVIGSIMPELVACKGFDQHTPYHIYDVWEHIAKTVSYTKPQRLNRWAALLHDIGKPGAFFMEGDRGHFYGHANISVVLGRQIMQRLKMSPAFVERVLLLVKMHDMPIMATPRSVRRMLAKLDGDTELFEALLDLKQADTRAHSPAGEERLHEIEQVTAIYRDLLEQDAAFSLKQLAISGRDVIGLGVEQGPLVGELLDCALDAVIDEQVANDHDQLLAFIKASISN